MKIPVYNSAGEEIKQRELPSEVFEIPVKPEIVHQAIVVQQAKARRKNAKTKDRSEVRGGGRKPWRQKGTGRARHGSIRSPLWKGGGVTFGPVAEKNFSLKINQKQKRLALAMSLSDRTAAGRLAIFDKLELDSGRTKELADWLKSLKDKITSLKEAKRILIVLDRNDRQFIRAAFNLAGVNTILADSLNCLEILKADSLITSEKALEIIVKHYWNLESAVEKK